MNVAVLLSVELDKIFAGHQKSSYFPCVICGSSITKKPAYFFRDEKTNIPKYYCFKCGYIEDGIKLVKRYNRNYNPFKHIQTENILNEKIMDLREYYDITREPNDDTKKFLVGKRHFNSSHIQQMHIRNVENGDKIFDKNIRFYGVCIPNFYNGKIVSVYIRSYDMKQIMKFSNSNLYSTYWNYANIDINKPVFVFESIFDAISSGIKNSISINGINFRNAHFQKCKCVILCFDNYNYDEAAKQAISKYKSKNVRIFNWGNLPYKDFNEWLEYNTSDEILNYIVNNIKNQNNYFSLQQKKYNCY